MNGSRRIYGYDLLRIVACFMIVIDHSAGGFLVTNPYNRWWVLLDAYFFLSKAGVALFFMLSGAVLLSKEDTTKEWLLKRVLRIIIVIIIFQFPHEVLTSETQFTFQSYLKFIWSSCSGSYWYLYSYLGIMVMLPILRKIAKSLSQKEYMIGFGLWFIFVSVIPQLVVDYGFAPYNGNFSVTPFSSSNIVFFLMGHYLSNVRTFKFERKEKIISLSVSLVYWLYVVLLNRYAYMNLEVAGNFLSYDRKDAPFSIIAAVTLFLFAQSLNIGDRLGRVLTMISQTTFGIYLMSDVVIVCMMDIYRKLLGFGLEAIFACICYDMIIFVGMAFLVWIVRFIPGVKKLI